MAFLAGQSAVIIPVPEAQPVVGGWRARFDAAAAVGVPAHVTVVYPFLPATELTDPVIDELRSIVAARPAFGVRFARCDRFPGVLFLAPEPDEPFRRLIADLVHRWPEAPPYGGEFVDPVPHLTVADVPTPAELDEAERDVTGRLPVVATVEAAWLIVFDGELWRRRAVLPLGAPEPDQLAEQPARGVLHRQQPGLGRLGAGRDPHPGDLLPAAEAARPGSDAGSKRKG